MKLLKAIGSTSQILEIFIQDSSSLVGAGLVGLTNASSGLTGYYHRSGDAAGGTSISIVSMTVGTFTSGGFKETDATNMPGWYQFCPPDAVFAAGRSASICLKGVTNMAQLNIEVQLTAVDVDDGTRFGLQALPNATINTTGGLGPTIIRAGTAQAGTTTTITLDAGASGQDEIYDTNIIFIVSGTGAGQSGSIKSYAGGTAICTMGKNWAIVPDNTSVFVMFALGVQAADNYATSNDIQNVLNEIDLQAGNVLSAISGVAAALPIKITKNVVLTGFPIFMVSSTDHVTGKTGLTVTAQRSLDGAFLGPCDNPVMEIGSGFYRINFSANDTNGDTMAFLFTATGADPLAFTALGQP
jgi:hypothetical protein